MKVFVTGATGLLGNNLVRQLRAASHEVVGLVRSVEKARRLLGDTGCRWVVGDMREPERFASALDGCERVFHTAAYFREYYQPGDHVASLETINVRGTFALLGLADSHGVQKFVHTSSGGTVGPYPDGTPGDEDAPAPAIAHSNLYFKSKLEGDAKIRAFTPRHGMAVVEVLPGWMWGPGDAGPTGAGRVALDFLARKLPAIPPGGMNVVDARDVAAAMIVAAERAPHGARYLVAGRPLTLAEIVAELSRASGIPGPKVRVPYAVAMVVATLSELWARLMKKSATVTRIGLRTMNAPHAVTSARAERELQATFRPFAETARDVIAWYRTHPISA